MIKSLQNRILVLNEIASPRIASITSIYVSYQLHNTIRVVPRDTPEYKTIRKAFVQFERFVFQGKETQVHVGYYF